MGVISKFVIGASVTGALTVGALTWNGSGNLTAVKGYAESMKQKVESLAGDISFLNNTISGKNGQIGQQKGRIAELETTIATLMAEKDTLQSELNKLNSENARIPELETQITNLQTTITDLETQTAYLQSQLTSLQANYDVEIEKANGEIAKANQESQELLDYVAALESETVYTYNTAKVDQTDPMYTVETLTSDPLAPIQGRQWSNPVEGFYDDAVFNLLAKFLQTEPVAGDGDGNGTEGWIATYTVEEPVLNDGIMDSLFDYIAKNSDISPEHQVVTFKFGLVNTGGSVLYGGYILRADHSLGHYVVEKF